MNSKRKPYKTYPKEFKVEAVRMMRESDKPAADIARELGIRRNQLYKWSEQLESHGEKAFSGRGRQKKKTRATSLPSNQRMPVCEKRWPSKKRWQRTLREA